MNIERCIDIIRRIDAIVDSRASVMERASFHAHLLMCGECRRYYRQYLDIRAAARAPTPEDLPQDFEKILGFVLAGEEGPPNREA